MFAKVIVDIPNLGALDYRVPDEMLVAVGDRVLVPVNSRTVPGVVVSLTNSSDYQGSRLKSIRQVLNDAPPLREEWLALTQFAAKYYVRTWGETAIPALPKFFRRAPRRGHLKKMEDFRQESVVDFSATAQVERPALNEEQLAALEDFKANLTSGYAPALLFGVTGSGKTEVYLRMIDEVLKRDPEAQVLLLVPEINLTPQLEQRVQTRFPLECVQSMHSECTDLERAQVWLSAHEGRCRILIGTRLSVFASFRNLALIIVDEEHDSSFKAHEGVQYSARDLAVWRAYKNRIPIVLGSATPSLESWHKAKSGAYRLLELKKRATGAGLLPELKLIDAPKGGERSLSDSAIEYMTDALDRGKQVLVFLNRRGYSPVLYCPSCGWRAQCEHCSSFMVYHKAERAMICHHCGSRQLIPRACPECGNVDILPRGIGTERLEEEIQRALPAARLERIDRDTVSRKHEAERAFRRVHAGEVDVLVGTQMVAKGHDFQNIDLVVVLESDALLTHPDVRAKEHLFVTLMQVSGRAGRATRRGVVLLQTNHPTDPFFEALLHQDYREFAESALAERERDVYVPYCAQALLVARATELERAMRFLTEAMKQGVAFAGTDIRVYDPVPMSLMRLKDVERAQLLVEADDKLTLNRFLWQWRAALPETTVDWSIEVDPSII